MSTLNWPGFGLASISPTLDQPSQSNSSGWTGTRTVITNPWHGKWSFRVTLATRQGDAAFQAARAFFTSLKGQINTFHLPAVEAPQNGNTGVTLSANAAQGATSIALTGVTTALVAGNMVTIAGQLLSLTSVGSLSGSAQTVNFQPALRAAASSGASVETAKPYALVYLADSKFSWDIGSWRRYGLTFDAAEAVGETDGADPALDVWTGGVGGGGGGGGTSFSFPQLTSFISRSLLAAVVPTDKQVAYLTEAGREGEFVFSSANLSAMVTADTAQGIHVAPAADTTGASGAWIRKFSGPLDVRWFGAPVKGDCTAVGTGTDIAPAINAAAAAGLALGKSCAIRIPGGTLGYRVASTLTFTSGLKLVGEGWHENPGTVGGTTYAAPQNWRGSILVFDANVKGMEFWDYTDNLANATAFEFEGSRFSILEDIALWGGGGTTVTAHGVQIHTIVRFRNVRIENFAGNGLHIVANTAGALAYGNADSSSFDEVYSQGNGCHGVYVSGNDANVLKFRGGSFANNGGCGYIDLTTVGNNKLDGTHFAVNNRTYGVTSAARTQVIADCALLSDQNFGSIHIANASVTPDVLDTIYIESGTGRLAHVPSGTLILGGFLGQIGSAALEATSAATIVDGAGNIQHPSLTLSASGILTIKHGAGGAVNIVDATGTNHVLKVAGTQVLSTRYGGTPAAATDPATTMALANYLRDALLNHHGAIG